jgi:hypothetical protein
MLSRLAVLALIAACSGVPETATTRAPAKPHAPIELSLSTLDLGGGHHTVTLEATARAPLASLELEIAGARRASFGFTPAGARRVLVADVVAEEVVGLARSPRGGRAVSLRTTPEPAAKRAASVVITPFGPVAH